MIKVCPYLVADFACPLRATPVNLALPLDHWTSSKGRRWKDRATERNWRASWQIESVGFAVQNQPAQPPLGAHTLGGDLSIVSSSNLPAEGQIDVTNFSVALFASQITRLSYAETSLFSLGSGRIRCFISPDSRRGAAKICRWHASGKNFAIPRTIIGLRLSDTIIFRETNTFLLVLDDK